MRDYLMTIIDGMSKGLFASLIVGVILRQIGILTNIEMIETIGQLAQFLMGASIGVGIAYARGASLFTLLASTVTGTIGAGSISIFTNDVGLSIYAIGVGEPVGAFVASIIGVEIGKLIEGRVKFALLIAPAVVILSGGIAGIFVSPYISSVMNQIGIMVNHFTLLQPLPMGLLLGLIIGSVVTLPISSAALCIAINISGISAGAAVAGTSAQMIGFAVSSFRENKFEGLLSQGLGTSMLQMKNVIRNPWIWLPASVASAVGGALSTTVFQMETTPIGAGMGTSGLVGQLETLSFMGEGALPQIIILHVLIPATISIVISEFLRHRRLIRFGDMRI